MLAFITSAVLLLAVQCSGRALNPTGDTAGEPSTGGVRGFLILAPLPSSSSAASLYIPLNLDSFTTTETPLDMKKRGLMDFVPNAETIAAFNEMNKKTADSWVPKATPPPAVSASPAAAPEITRKASSADLSSDMSFMPDSAAIAAFNDLTKSLNKATWEAWVAKATPSVSAAVPSASIAAAPQPFGKAPLSALQARTFFM